MRNTLMIFCLALGAPLMALDDDQLQQRIHDLRTGDLSLTVTNADASPYTGAISYDLYRHAFPFGTAIADRGIGFDKRNDPKALSAEDIQHYRDIVTTYFSAVVCENEMKWTGMEKAGGVRNDERALAMWQFAHDHDVYMRGHCVAWGVRRWLPDWQKDMDPAITEAAVKARFDYVLKFFDGKVTEWDLVNELMAEDCWQEKMGWKNSDQYFTWARDIAPNNRYFINEFKGLQDGTPEKIVTFAKSLQNRGVVIDGIGDQAHFFRPVPDADTLWAQLDVYAATGLPLVITEFDLNYKGMSEDDQAEQLRRMVTTCFAHPGVHGFYLWGFWDGRHWRKNCGLWNKDWTPKPAAIAWMELMATTWHTNGDVAESSGGVSFRGFPGLYHVTIAGQTHTVDLRIDQPITLTLPAP